MTRTRWYCDRCLPAQNMTDRQAWMDQPEVGGCQGCRTLTVVYPVVKRLNGLSPEFEPLEVNELAY